jgi:hypothetical protein
LLGFRLVAAADLPPDPAEIDFPFDGDPNQSIFFLL